MNSKYAEDYKLIKQIEREKDAARTVQPDSLDALFASMSVS